MTWWVLSRSLASWTFPWFFLHSGSSFGFWCKLSLKHYCCLKDGKPTTFFSVFVSDTDVTEYGDENGTEHVSSVGEYFPFLMHEHTLRSYRHSSYYLSTPVYCHRTSLCLVSFLSVIIQFSVWHRLLILPRIPFSDRAIVTSKLELGMINTLLCPWKLMCFWLNENSWYCNCF